MLENWIGMDAGCGHVGENLFHLRRWFVLPATPPLPPRELHVTHLSAVLRRCLVQVQTGLRRPIPTGSSGWCRGRVVSAI